MYPFFIKFQIAYRSFSNQLHDVLLPYGLTANQWGLIRYLFESGPATFSDVANFWQVEKPTITPTAQKLIEREYIYILPGMDKRQKMMHLSDRGIEMYKKIKQSIEIFQEDLMEDIPKEERKIAVKIMDQLMTNLRKRG